MGQPHGPTAASSQSTKPTHATDLMSTSDVKPATARGSHSIIEENCVAEKVREKTSESRRKRGGKGGRERERESDESGVEVTCRGRPI